LNNQYNINPKQLTIPVYILSMFIKPFEGFGKRTSINLQEIKKRLDRLEKSMNLIPFTF